jgi:cytochrome P450
VTDAPLTDPLPVLFSPDVAADPQPVYARMRDECPVARSEIDGLGATIVLSRYADVMWALKHPDVFSSSAEAFNIGQQQELIPLQMDPPEHAKYRRLLDPEFSPRRMQELEPDARRLVNEIIDRFAGRGECDFHEELATPLPSTIFLRLMGLPASDLTEFLRWRDATIRPDIEPGDIEGAQRIREETGRQITAYFEDAIADRRAHPDDALLSRLVHGEVEGRPPTDAELLGMLHLLLLAGLDTVTATLDCMVAYLGTHPDRRDAISADPSLATSAIEELLRTETPVQMVPRMVKADTEFGGVAMQQGDTVTVCIGAANTDEAEFTDASQVQLDRAGNRHVAFGAGPHRCLGSHLARLELRVAMEELHRRIPDYRVADGAQLSYSPGIRQTESLPIVFTPA